MLWDLIRDFFVQNVFGGMDSNGVSFGGVLGYINAYQDGVYDDGYLGGLGDAHYLISNENGLANYIGLSDWLSTTATMISITIILVLCCLFVYKIIKLIGGLIR